MGKWKPRPDPLHDGSIGSYVARFFICLVLGVLFDLLVVAGGYVMDPIWMFEFWYIWLLLPVVFGVCGIFAFDHIIGIYEKVRRSHLDQ